jgi:hypothetical protein
MSEEYNEEGGDQTTVIDLTGVPTELEAIPRGYYPFVVVDCEKRFGQESGAPYYAWVFEVSSGDHEGRKLFHNTTLQDPPWAFKQLLIALGFDAAALEQEITFDPEEAKGLEGIAYVTHREWGGRTRNNVQRVLSSDAEVVTEGQASMF